MRYKDVLLATRSDLRDALIAGDPEKAERIYQECEAEYQKNQPVCGSCNGTGWMVRDPDIGTDQECGCIL
jgi:hypothetical protein